MRILALIVLLAPTWACSSTTASGKIRLTFVEYNRGMSAPGNSDLAIGPDAGGTRFHDLRLEGLPFFPDDSVIPNAFIKPLFHLDIPAAVKAFTEPYYGVRVYRFFAKHPQWGIGLDFTHLKAFMADPTQRVQVTGPWPRVAPDGTVALGDHFEDLNVSHGVNHVAVNAAYRWMLRPSSRFPDGRFQPYVTAGGGPAVPHLELTVKSDGQLQRKAFGYQWRFGNWGIGAGAGLRWRFASHLGVYGEYRWTYSILDNMTYDNGEDVSVRMRFSSQHALWGISIGF